MNFEAPGVTNIGGQVFPGLSNNPAAVGLVQNRLSGALSDAAKAQEAGITPTQTMMGLNNALEGLKKTVAESGKFGESMAGQASGAGISGWQQALDSLAADPQALADHNAANLQFRKGLALKDIVDQAIGTKTGATAGFSPREAAFSIARAGGNGGADLSALSPQEQAALQNMVQARPSVMSSLIQRIQGIQKDLGAEKLHFHPGNRFYEMAPNYTAPGQLLTAGANQGRDQDVDQQRLADMAQRLSQMAGAR